MGSLSISAVIRQGRIAAALVVVGTLATACGSTAATSSATSRGSVQGNDTAAGSWSNVKELNDPVGGGDLTGVSCTSPGFCTAVGNDNNGAIYVTQRSGTWGQIRSLVTPGNLQIRAVSCSSQGNCTAVGAFSGSTEAPGYVTESSGTWSPPSSLNSQSVGAVFDGVSCTSPGNCVAVGGDVNGGFYANESSGTWGPITYLVQPGAPVGGGFGDVSCSSPGNCTAVGGNYNGETYVTQSAGLWGSVGVVNGLSAQFVGVSCTSPGNCTAVDNKGAYSIQKSGSWEPLVMIRDHGVEYFSGISCTSQADCLAVGTTAPTNGHLMYAAEMSGSWSQATSFSSPSGGSIFKSVSCISPHDCTAVGIGDNSNYAIVARRT